jgi:hypothetical protein
MQFENEENEVSYKFEESKNVYNQYSHHLHLYNFVTKGEAMRGRALLTDLDSCEAFQFGGAKLFETCGFIKINLMIGFIRIISLHFLCDSKNNLAVVMFPFLVRSDELPQG